MLMDFFSRLVDDFFDISGKMDGFYEKYVISLN